MGKQKSTQQQEQAQQFQQQETQNFANNTTGLNAEQQATSSLQQFLNQFSNQGTSTQQQQQQQNQQQNVNTTGTMSLSPLQQPVAQQYFDDLMKQYTGGTLGPQPYTGPRVAGLTPAQIQSQNMATNYATGAGTNFANEALVANSRLLSPDMLDPSKVPGLDTIKAANTTNLTRNLTENQLPMIRNEALLTGGFGGSKQGIAEGLATGRTNEAIINANAGLDMNAYNQGLAAMQQALGLAPATAALGVAPAQVVGQVGAQQQAQQQAEIAGGEAAFREQQAAPAQTLALLQSLLGTQGQYGGTTSQVGQTTGATTGATTATGTEQQSGQQSGSQFAQQLASLLGINLGTNTGTATGTSSGTSSGIGQTTQNTKPSLLQSLGAIGSLLMLPSTFGGMGQGGMTPAPVKP